MFVDRARAARPDFQITAANAQTVATLCRRLEGIPLAIELTAGWASMLTPAQILERLNRRFDLLTSRRKDLPLRHRTLRATIEWSYLLLSPELQRFFAGLSVFRNGWTLEAAEVICEEPNALEYLDQLRQRSLVFSSEIGGQMRFRLLESLREYAAEQLTVEERSLHVQCHAAFYLEFAEAAAPRLHGPQQMRWLEYLEAEHDNFRAVLDSLGEAEADIETGLRLAGALWWFWRVRGYWREGRERLLTLVLQSDALPPSPPRACVLYAAGCLQGLLADYPAAAALLERSLAIARQCADEDGIGNALHALGNVTLDQGNVEQARALLQENLKIRRRRGDLRGIGASLLLLGNLELSANITLARSYYEQSLAIRRELGDRKGMASALNNLGEVARDRGEYPQANTFYEESLNLSRELGDRLGIATALGNLGVVAKEQSDYPAAQNLLEQSLVLARELKEHRGIATTLANLGAIAHHRGEFTRAHELYQESLMLHRALGYRWGEATTLRHLGYLWRDQDDYDQAQTYFQQNYALVQQLGDQHGVSMALYNLGSVAWRKGDVQEARSCWKACLELDREIGVWGGSVLGALGRLETHEGDYAHARLYWTGSLKDHKEIGDRKGAIECLEGLAELRAAQTLPEPAVRLLGAAEARRAALNAPLPPESQTEHKRLVATLRTTLPPSSFAACWKEGRAMTLEQAIAAALDTSVSRHANT